MIKATDRGQWIGDADETWRNQRSHVRGVRQRYNTVSAVVLDDESYPREWYESIHRIVVHRDSQDRSWTLTEDRCRRNRGKALRIEFRNEHALRRPWQQHSWQGRIAGGNDRFCGIVNKCN